MSSLSILVLISLFYPNLVVYNFCDYLKECTSKQCTLSYLLSVLLYVSTKTILLILISKDPVLGYFYQLDLIHFKVRFRYKVIFLDNFTFYYNLVSLLCMSINASSALSFILPDFYATNTDLFLDSMCLLRQFQTFYFNFPCPSVLHVYFGSHTPLHIPFLFLVSKKYYLCFLSVPLCFEFAL